MKLLRLVTGAGVRTAVLLLGSLLAWPQPAAAQTREIVFSVEREKKLKKERSCAISLHSSE